MSGVIRSGGITPLGGMGGLAVNPWQSVRRTVGLVVFGWAAAGATTYVAYLALGTEAIPIMVGTLLCFAFAILMTFLHRAWWLTVLSAVPSLFILVGAVQYAPEAALERRGVRESVVIVADSADDASGDHHRLTLRGTDGNKLDEQLEYDADIWDPKVGDRLDIIRDPENTVPMEQADNVDAAGRLSGLVGGTATWTLMAILAGWRGHVRRRRGRDSLVDQLM